MSTSKLHISFLRKAVRYGALLAFVFVMCASRPAGAVSLNDHVCNGSDASAAVCQDSGPASNPLFGPHGVLTVVVQILNIVVGVAAVVVIIIAGIKFVTSNGDANAVSSARSTIIYAVIGLLVAVLSQGLLFFVLAKL